VIAPFSPLRILLAAPIIFLTTSIHAAAFSSLAACPDAHGRPAGTYFVTASTLHKAHHFRGAKRYALEILPAQAVHFFACWLFREIDLANSAANLAGKWTVKAAAVLLSHGGGEPGV
jgi:hypothetical protein